MAGYTVKTDVFEGPFDLLLHLVSRQRLDVSAISVSDIADQYLEHLERMRELDLDVASDFLVLAANQLVNHLDKLGEMTRETPPKVIVRTSIGSERPLHPGPQHTGDFTDAFRLLLPHMELVRLDEPEDVYPAYLHAAERTDGVSTILVEWGDFHGEK